LGECRDRARLQKAESHRLPCRKGDGIFVHTGGKSHGVWKIESKKSQRALGKGAEHRANQG
jgi:hypothetical protein